MMPMRPRPNVVFVLGPPRSGKGTQCAMIQEKFGFVHLSAGDLLRAERKRVGSEFGELIESHIRNGTIVPVEITCKLLDNAIHGSGDAKGFLIDGFPRNQDNLNGWEREMNEKVNLRFVLFLNCAAEVCIQRCLARQQGRSDDNLESLQLRVQTYVNETMPIVQLYTRDGLVESVDATLTTAEVSERVVEAMEARGFSANE